MVPSRVKVLAVLVLAVPLLYVDGVTARSQGQRPVRVVLFPASIMPGDVVRVDIDGAASDEFTATVFGQPLMFAFDQRDRKWTALAGVDVETKPGRYRLRIRRKNTPIATRTIRVIPKRFRVRRLRVPESFVDPSPEALKQIALDTQTLAETYSHSTPQRWNGAFGLPVDGKPTSNFGTRSYYNGRRRAPHSGVDFMSEPGTPVAAANHGIVALAAPLYFTGNTVIIDHGANLFSVFAHLSEFRVKTGEVVSPDMVVGLVGDTGRVTGPHLHWGVRLNGARVDPLSLIAATQGRER